MKRTKTVEVNVCDLCGKEQGYVNHCTKCERELCPQCSTYISIDVKDVVCRPRVTHVSTRKLDLRATYCTECAGELEIALRELGFEIVEPPQAGMHLC